MDEEQMRKLITQLHNGNEQQRRAASYKLRRFKDPAAVRALIDAYKDSDSSVRQNAIDGLRNIRSTQAVDFLNSHGVSLVAPRYTNKAVGKRNML